MREFTAEPRTLKKAGGKRENWACAKRKQWKICRCESKRPVRPVKRLLGEDAPTVSHASLLPTMLE